MTRYIILLSFCMLFAEALIGQEIRIDAANRPLNKVFMELAAQYDLEISYDDATLSQFTVTLSSTFQSADEAIGALLKDLPLEYERTGDVFVIFPEKKKGPETRNISGLVLDKTTLEPLPYSHVIINNRGVATDLKGSFAFVPFDSVYNIRVSHLGYYIIDTLLRNTSSLKFLMTPSFIGLTEIEVKNSIISRSGLIGEEAGQMKLNHQVANFLPGFGDNSVFNLLRLQPGILASGEQTNELIIWGSYEGQSKIMFDGFTIYSLKNFNDNISAFNPLMAKDITVYKGGYDARYGDRVGGIVNVSGINGNRRSTSFTMNLNNMTLNSLLEVPIRKKSSLVIAFRTTYYELYNPSDINTKLWRNNNQNDSDDVNLNIIPDYRFSDLNLKYSANFSDQDLFYISLYGGTDKFSYSVTEPLPMVVVTKSTEERNRQGGGSAFYGRTWDNGSSTNFNFTYSYYISTFSDSLLTTRKNGMVKVNRDEDSRNTIRESSSQVDHRLALGHNQVFEAGLIFKRNVVELHEDTFQVVQAHFDDTATLMTLFLQDHISLGQRTLLKAGLRINRSVNLQRFFLEPRLSLSFNAADNWKINAAWGMYDQFVARSSVVDEQGNFRYIWTVCDDQEVPVLKAFHYVLGTSYIFHEFTLSLEGYYKTTTGLTRFVRNNQFNQEGIFEGKGRSYGIDVMIKKDYRGHSAWISYSLSRTEELFEYFLDDNYRRAPQDQRHEVKAALLLNFDPIYFSTDYVFGSGFPTPAYLGVQPGEDLTYSRLDVALIYKFLDRRLKGEIGLSVLNVLNTENIKYANFERIPTDQTNSINFYAEAIPITPALYLKLSL